jgi:hypothetical protein
MKKYTSLTDLYCENVAFKPTPKLNRHRVLLKDEVEVLFKTDTDSKPRIIGTIDDAYSKVLQRKIINKGGDTVKIVDKILQQSGWMKGHSDRDYIGKVLGPVNTIIEETSDVNERELLDFAKNKSSHTEFVDALISAASEGTSFNILDPLLLVGDTIFSNASKTLSEIFNVEFAISGVGVGRGEVLITLLSNGVKGNEGDLHFPDYGDVELKGSAGRVGKTGNPYEAIKTLPSMLKARGHDVTTGKQILKNVELISRNRREVIKYIEDRVAAVVKKGNAQNLVEVLQNYIQRIDEVDATDKELDVNAIVQLQIGMVSEIKRAGFPWPTKKLESVVINFFESLKNYINSIKNRIPQKEDNMSWKDVVENFFLNDWGLTKDEIIDGFMELKNERTLSSAELSGVRDGLNELLTPDILIELIVNHNNKLLRSIVGALQITIYQLAEKFEALLLVNSDKFDALPLIFEGNPTEKFINTFDTVYKLNQSGALTLSLGIDSRSKGINLTFNG